MLRSATTIVSGLATSQVCVVLVLWASRMGQPQENMFGHLEEPARAWGFLVFFGAIGIIVGAIMLLRGLWVLLNNLDEVHQRQLAR